MLNNSTFTILPNVFEVRPRGIQYPEGSIAGDNYCTNPHKTLSIDADGNCFVCLCDAYLPIVVGNILDFNDLSEVWKSKTAGMLQGNVANKKFTYCAVDHCGIRERNIDHKDYQIFVNIDESCNLACPSCRRGLINNNSGPDFDRQRTMADHLVKLLNKFDQPTELTMCGNGDPLASQIMRPIVLNWIPTANQKIRLFTNGHLMKKLLPDSPLLPNIKWFRISVDAGSREVYEIVRRPGKFSVLTDNLTWLSEYRGPAPIHHVELCFCLSSLNVSDVINFADMCERYGFHGDITKLDDWGTFDDFNAYDVSNPAHPSHTLALDQLRAVQDRSYIYIQPLLKNLL